MDTSPKKKYICKQAYEKLLHIICPYGTSSCNREIPLTTHLLARPNPKLWQHQMLASLGSKRTRLYSGGAAKWDSHGGRHSASFLIKIDMLLPYDPIIMPFGICTDKLITYRHRHKPAQECLRHLYNCQTQRQLWWPSAAEWTRKL